jgi:hypothetical protein
MRFRRTITTFSSWPSSWLSSLPSSLSWPCCPPSSQKLSQCRPTIDMHAFRVHHNFRIDTARFEEGKRAPARDRMKCVTCAHPALCRISRPTKRLERTAPYLFGSATHGPRAERAYRQFESLSLRQRNLSRRSCQGERPTNPWILQMFVFWRISRAGSDALIMAWRMLFSPRPSYQNPEVQRCNSPQVKGFCR